MIYLAPKIGTHPIFPITDMKKILLIFISFLLLSFNQNAQKVFICDSSGAKKYHYSETCRGLNPCKHQIIKIAIEDAKAKKLTLCGWEE